MRRGAACAACAPCAPCAPLRPLRHAQSTNQSYSRKRLCFVFSPKAPHTRLLQDDSDPLSFLLLRKAFELPPVSALSSVPKCREELYVAKPAVQVIVIFVVPYVRPLNQHTTTLHLAQIILKAPLLRVAPQIANAITTPAFVLFHLPRSYRTCLSQSLPARTVLSLSSHES